MNQLRPTDFESVQTDVQFLRDRIERCFRLNRRLEIIDAALGCVAVVLTAFTTIFLLTAPADREPRVTNLSIALFVFVLLCLAQLAYRLRVYFTTNTQVYGLPLICFVTSGINCIVMGAALVAWLHVQYNLSTLL